MTKPQHLPAKRGALVLCWSSDSCGAIYRRIWESAGFQVIAFDKDDRGAALGISKELGWDGQAGPLKESIRAAYTPLKRPN